MQRDGERDDEGYDPDGGEDESPDNLLYAGRELIAAKRFEEAIPVLSAALEDDPENGEVWGVLGRAYYNSGQFNAALHAYDEATTKDPTRAWLWNNRGLVLADLQHLDEAIASYDHALALNPQHVSALNNKGNTLIDQGHYADAVRILEQAVSLTFPWVQRGIFSDVPTSGFTIDRRLLRHTLFSSIQSMSLPGTISVVHFLKSTAMPAR